jgi:hypothetical protein
MKVTRRFCWFLVGYCQVTVLGCERQSAPPRERARAMQLTASLAVKRVPSAVRAVCDSIADAWHAVSRARVVTGDTAVFPLDGDSSATDVAGCQVIATLDSTVDSASSAVLFWNRSSWPMDPVWLADGPDGQTKVYQRGLVRCEVGESWESGDDTDPTYVPSPWTQETSTCYEARTPLQGGVEIQPETPSPRRGPGSFGATSGAIIWSGRRDGDIGGLPQIERAFGCERRCVHFGAFHASSTARSRSPVMPALAAIRARASAGAALNQPRESIADAASGRKVRPAAIARRLSAFMPA